MHPDYKRIYKDILKRKLPKNKDCIALLQKEHLSAIDVMEINRKIFGTTKETENYNQRHRSYSKTDIFKILDYQKKYNLNNSQLSNHFKISRNTISKWRKIFLT